MKIIDTQTQSSTQRLLDKMDYMEKSIRETVKENRRSTNKMIMILQVITVAFAGAVATAGLLNYFKK